MKMFFIIFVAVACALVVVLAGYNLIVEKERPGYIVASNLAQGLASASTAKITITEYWMQTGKLPCTSAELEEIGYPMPQQVGDSVLRSMALTGCGQITLDYQPIGETSNGRVFLQAQVVENNYQTPIRWICITMDFPDIARFMPRCIYQAPDSE